MFLTFEQQECMDIIMEKVRRFRPLPWSTFIYKVGGYAGTGKTFLISQLRNEIHTLYKSLNIAFCSFTGKAASVLKNKLKDASSLYSSDYIGTIHGLIYRPDTVYDRRLKTYVVVGWKKLKKHEVPYDIIIIDEGSMVSRELWQDLVELEKPIIIFGDHGQLPPVSKLVFSLMHKPDFILKQIHRQAEDNPIIQLSAFIRRNGYIPFNHIWSEGVFKISWDHKHTKNIWNNIEHDEKIITLCGFNTTRCGLNKNIRERIGHTELVPIPGERIVCLRNNHTIKLMNGQIGTLMWLMPEDQDIYRFVIDVDNEHEPFESIAHSSTFGQVTYTTYNLEDNRIKRAKKYAKDAGFELDFYDYGYCISVHKAQGSEWDKVILFEQRTKFWDNEYYKRWLYTGVTRAREKLMVISDYWG